MKKYSILLFVFLACVSTITIVPGCKKPHNQTQKSESKRFQLYSYTHCPYCDKVKDFLKARKVIDSFELVNADQKENYKKLLELSNQHYCPFLWDKTAKKGVVGSDKIKSYVQKLIDQHEI